MNVFDEYKPVRNKIKLLAIDDALSVIWAYCQYLQINDFAFPTSIEVPPFFLREEITRRLIAEWELELLAKEVIVNAGVVSSKGRTLKTWKTISEILNGIKDLENRIYGHYRSPEKVLLEFNRIAHRQFIWQSNSPNSASTIRYYKIFNRPKIDEVCLRKLGLTVWQIYMCGTAVMGALLDRPAITASYKNEIDGLTLADFAKFFEFCSRPISELKTVLKDGQQFNENFAYTYNALRTYPLVKMSYDGSESYVCPLLTLLYWRFTGGLYYELVGEPEFGNEFGDGFQDYVGDVIVKTSSNRIERIAETAYSVGKLEKRPIDWIAADEISALFLECKSRRLSWGAKADLSDLSPLEADIEIMATAVVQVYKTIDDHLNGYYQHFAFKEERKLFPTIVTLENWRLFGPAIMDRLDDCVRTGIEDAGISADRVSEMPYSIIAIEELEVALQFMSRDGIGKFMGGKLNDPEMRNWDWHAYMVQTYKDLYPAKTLFQDEYDNMFLPLYLAQKQTA